MGIGRAGKQARQTSQQQQRRYQMQYGPTSEATLPPPRRSRPSPSEPVADTVRRMPSVEPVDIDSAAQADTPDVVQRADDSSSGEGATNSEGKISAKEVADRVYALLLRDIKREQERLGTFRKIR